MQARLTSQTRGHLMWKNLRLWKICSKWMCSCHCIVVFPYLLRSWNRFLVPG